MALIKIIAHYLDLERKIKWIIERLAGSKIVVERK